MGKVVENESQIKELKNQYASASISISLVRHQSTMSLPDACAKIYETFSFVLEIPRMACDFIKVLKYL